MEIKGIIFDYGGTLDSRGDHWSEVIYRGYQAAGLAIDKSAFREAYVYAERYLATHPVIEPQHTFHDLMLRKVEIELTDLASRGIIGSDDVTRCTEPIARYCYDFARQCVAEALPVIRQLAARYPLVLVSNFYGNVEAVITDMGLRPYFKDIIESAVVGVRKPDPAIFMLGVQALGLQPSQVLVVGDSYRKDIVPARSIGCAVAWIKGKGWDAAEDAVTDPCIIPSLSTLLHTLL